MAYISVPPLRDVSVTASGAVQDLTVSGLNGDADGDYEIDFNLISASGGTIVMRPNGVTVNQEIKLFYTDGTAFGAPQSLTTLQLAGAAAATFQGRVLFQSRSGRGRFFSVNSYDQTDHLAVYAMGFWNDTVTNITSLVFHHANAGGLSAGSVVRVRALNKPG